MGGIKWNNELCYEGHIGALCEECDVHTKKYKIIVLFIQTDRRLDLEA